MREQSIESILRGQRARDKAAGAFTVGDRVRLKSSERWSGTVEDVSHGPFGSIARVALEQPPARFPIGCFHFENIELDTLHVTFTEACDVWRDQPASLSDAPPFVVLDDASLSVEARAE